MKQISGVESEKTKALGSESQMHVEGDNTSAANEVNSLADAAVETGDYEDTWDNTTKNDKDGSEDGNDEGAQQEASSAVTASHLLLETLSNAVPRDIRKYDEWYSPSDIEGLTQSLPIKDLLVHIFMDADSSSERKSPVEQFRDQLSVVIEIYRGLHVGFKIQGLCFICKEPGAGENHFIFGLIMLNSLIIINPTGQTKHKDFYEIIQAVRSKHTLTIYISNTVIQQDQKGIVNCGPICVELMRHISQLSAGDIAQYLTSTHKLKDKDNNVLEVIELLPPSLISTAGEYKGAIERIREGHHMQLKMQTEEIRRLNMGVQAAINDTVFADRESLKEKLKENVEKIKKLLEGSGKLQVAKQGLPSAQPGDVPTLQGRLSANLSQKSQVELERRKKELISVRDFTLNPDAQVAATQELEVVEKKLAAMSSPRAANSGNQLAALPTSYSQSGAVSALKSFVPMKPGINNALPTSGLHSLREILSKSILGIYAFITHDQNGNKTNAGSLIELWATTVNVYEFASNPLAQPALILDLSRDFSVKLFLEDRQISVLAQREYIRLIGQVLDPRSIVIIDDQQVVDQSSGVLIPITELATKQGINQAATGIPIFFIISNGKHWAITALLPNGANGEVQVIYMNSAYGKEAEGYYLAKFVGLDSCQAIVTAVNEKRLNNGHVRTAVVAEHIYLEPSQQMVNNCGSVAGLNIAGLAAWHKAGRPEEITIYLGRLEYNRILAKRERDVADIFEAYVRARFAEVKLGNDAPVFPLLPVATYPAVQLKSINISVDQYALMVAQIDADKARFEGAPGSNEYDIEQQRALLEFYAKRKVAFEKRKGINISMNGNEAIKEQNKDDQYETHFDDSSDEEDAEEVGEQDCELRVNEFTKNNIGGVILGIAHHSCYSFLTHELGLQLLCSKAVNTEYYKYKRSLLSKSIAIPNEVFKQWVEASLKQVIKEFVLVMGYDKALEVLLERFYDQCSDYINLIINKCVDAKRALMKHLENDTFWQALSGIIGRLEQTISRFVEYTHGQEYFKDYYDFTEDVLEFNPANLVANEVAYMAFLPGVKSLIEQAFTQRGLLNANKAIKVNQVKSFVQSNPELSWWERAIFERVMSYDEQTKSLNVFFNTIPPNSNSNLKELTYLYLQVLIEQERKRDGSIINGKGRIMLHAHFKGSHFEHYEEALIDFTPNRKFAAFFEAIQEAIDNSKNDLYQLFVAKLNHNKKALFVKVEVERRVLPNSYEFHAENYSIVRFLAAMRLCNRSTSRLRKNFRSFPPPYNSSTVLMRTFRFPLSDTAVMERQELTVNFAKKDLVITAGSYDDIYRQISSIKDSANIQIGQSGEAVQDKDIAYWIQEALKGNKLDILIYVDSKKPVNIGKMCIKFIKELILNIAYLLFGTEVRRNPASLIHNQMMLDLIQTKDSKFTWQNVLTGLPFGGGYMPMSMTRDKWVNEQKTGKKESEGAVQCARTLHMVFARFTSHRYKYEGEAADISHPKVNELVKREYEITIHWLHKCRNSYQNTSFADQVKCIKDACKGWYGIDI